jgi:ABC-type glutathione transport system ATPase component
MTARETLLTVRELTVRFATEDGAVLAVDRASFEVARGEVLALVGESGCGKTVTAMALTRLLPRTATQDASTRLSAAVPANSIVPLPAPTPDDAVRRAEPMTRSTPC